MGGRPEAHRRAGPSPGRLVLPWAAARATPEPCRVAGKGTTERRVERGVRVATLAPLYIGSMQILVGMVLGVGLAGAVFGTLGCLLAWRVWRDERRAGHDG